MLQVQDLAKSHTLHPLFKQASFSLGRGEKLALVGRNGCGKTSLMRLIAGQESPDVGQIHWARGVKMGYLDQHRLFKQESVLQEVIEALPSSYYGLSYRAEQILEGLGVHDQFWSLHPDKLSGGYRLRLALAVLLAQELDIILLDEPTNHLDLPSVIWLQKFLTSYPSAMIIISHDRSFLDAVCDFTAGIYQSQLFFVRGTTSDYFAHLMAREVAHLALKQKTERYVEKQNKFIERFRAKATKSAQVKSREKQLAKLPKVSEWLLCNDIEIQLHSADRVLPRLIWAKEVAFSYEPPKPLIGPLDVEWGGCDRLALVGANGRGKSTLLKLLVGQLKPTKGSIESHPQTKLGYFGQSSLEELDLQATPIQVMLQATKERKLNEQQARQYLGSFGIETSMQMRPLHTLSGGERSRVVLALISSQPVHGLILDEPTHHLDIETVESLMQSLSHFEGSVILVTHSTSTLEAFDPDQLLVFENGKQLWYRQGYQAWIREQLDGESEKSSKTESLTPSISSATKVKQEIPKVEKKATTSPIASPSSHSATFHQQEKELKKQIQQLERKMDQSQKSADELQNKIDGHYLELAKAHQEQNLPYSRDLMNEIALKESKRSAELEAWFEFAQKIEQTQNELNRL